MFWKIFLVVCVLAAIGLAAASIRAHVEGELYEDEMDKKEKGD
jgi:hypothetical protein